ncbi:gluconolaconase [bacterium]|nr:MAG: gluconolaconase [bacterium]
MPTGIAVSQKGRIFVTYPRWGDPVKATVVEIRNGQEIPYPNVILNRLSKAEGDQRFVSVQSLVVDARDRLWAVDTGSVNLGLTRPKGPKLWCFNLATNRVDRVYAFPETVALPTTYLNDARFDLTRGKAGYAFLTDSSDKGPNGLIVLDLASGKSWRRLNDHPSTKAEPKTMSTAEGYGLLMRMKDGTDQRVKIGSDGIAIFPRRDELVYCPLVSNTLYSVRISDLIDDAVSDDELGGKVVTKAKKPGSDGLLEGPNGELWILDYENARIQKWNGTDWTTSASLPKYEWPDTLALHQGWVYTIANQLQRQPQYHRGHDLRKKPYRLVRFRG